MEAQNEELQAQTEELQTQSEVLLNQTKALASSNDEIKRQNDEIMKQASALNESYRKIQKHHDDLEAAYKELNLYRNQLEELVDERTRELILSKEKAEESDRLKSSFLANLSHEIRTPLNAIIGFSGILSDSELTEEERESYNLIIRRSSDTLLNLINDVIDFSKIEAGFIEVNFADIPVSKIVSQVQDIFNLEDKKQHTGTEGDINFIVNVPTGFMETFLHTDEIRLMQIIGNLINNAIKFTPKGIIEFGCNDSVPGKWIKFYVRDTGIGIKKENQTIIFQRFRKLEEENNKLYRGAGLGLAISSELINLLGGHISVESEPGAGSIFSITVPVKKTTNEISKTPEPRHKSLYPDFSGKNILVVEDDTSNYIYLNKVLRKMGSNVIRALNGIQAVSIAETNPNLHVILMDIKMPGMDGIQALQAIRKSNNPVPVIAQTAYALTDEVTKLKEAGFDNYLAKPIKTVDLFHVLESVFLKMPG